MAVLLACIGSGIAAGLLVALVAARWPRLNPSGFGFIGLMAFAFALLLWMIRVHVGVAQLDLHAAEWAAGHATRVSTEVLRLLTNLGATAVGVVLLTVVSVLELRRGSRRTVIAFLVVTVAGQNAIVNIAKIVIGRTRPDIERLAGFSSASFPSGHAALAASMFAAFALVLGRRRSHYVRATLAGAAVGIAVMVAATRVLLGVHWLTDVLAGLAVGWGWFAVVSVVFGGRWLQFADPVEHGVSDETTEVRPRDEGRMA